MADESKESTPKRYPKIRRRRRSRAPDTVDRLAGSYFWGGWVGVLMDILSMRRVRNSIRESRRRRVERNRQDKDK